MVMSHISMHKMHGVMYLRRYTIVRKLTNTSFGTWNCK